MRNHSRQRQSRIRASALRWLFALALPFLLLACTDPDAPLVEPRYSNAPPQDLRPSLTLAIHPLHNPTKLFELYGPIIDALNSAIPEFRIRLEASRDYADFEQKLRDRQVELALPNPYQTITALGHGYHIFAKVKGDEDFHGIILVRKDGNAPREIGDLKRKTVSCPSRTALAACMLPLLHLQEQGLDVAREIKIVTVGSQESSMLNLARGLVDAAATWPPPWRAFQKDHPELARQLEVRWVTPHLPNNSLMARDDVHPQLIERIRAHLVAMSDSEAGRALTAHAEIQGFEPASEATYAPVNDFLDRYRVHFGALPQ